MQRYDIDSEKVGIKKVLIENEKGDYVFFSDVKEEIDILRMMLWMNHGHTGMYGDDGEMQCSQCMTEYGFFDWKRTPAKEIRERIYNKNIKEFLVK